MDEEEFKAQSMSVHIKHGKVSRSRGLSWKYSETSTWHTRAGSSTVVDRADYYPTKQQALDRLQRRKMHCLETMEVTE